MLKIGTEIDGKYKVLNEIGHGGMSTVYLAINEKANKPWAIKEVRKCCSSNYEVLQQSLIVETDLLKKLKHPNLPSIVDIIDNDENFLIVMDYIEGNTLEKLLMEKGAQPQEAVVNWAMQLCDVLIYLHTRPMPIVYRDMKPSNIMLKSDGSVVLIDFGTAREFKKRCVTDTFCLGTQGYAAPEQFGGMGQTDARTDIYSLGATMYHLLTGHNPSAPPYEMYPITKWRPELSNGLEQVILKCTQKNPDDRYQSTEELMYALQHYHDYETQMQRRYHRRMGIFSAVLSIALMCAAGGWGIHTKAKERQNDNYNAALEMAQHMTSAEEAIPYYMKAIQIDTVREHAYHGYYNTIIEDGVFSETEEEALLHLNISAERYLQHFAQKNPVAYADFCYEMGNAYWYYYIHEESRQSNAVSWFEAAMYYYENREEKATEYRRSCLYVEIGRFYKKITAAQIDGSDAGMYGAYWANLSALKALHNEMHDREWITLRMYREIVSRVTEYAKYLYDDGVSKEEIYVMLKEIEQDMEEMEHTGSSTVKEEIASVQAMTEGAYKMVRSSYKETGTQ